MFTYAVYNFILFSSTLSAYLYEKAQSKIKQKLYYSIAFFIPFFFLAIRYDIGTDYQNYVEYFYRIANGEMILKEPGYLIVNYLIIGFDLDVQWLFVFFGFFFLYFSFNAFPKKGFALGVFLFLSVSYFYEGFSAIRQGLAIGILAYSMRFIGEGKLVKYLLFVFLASFFHVVTAVLWLLIYPLVKINFNKAFLIIVILISFFLIKYTGFVDSLLQLAVSIFPKYAWYLNSKFMQAAAVGSGLGVLLKIFFVLMAIFFKEKIVTKYKNSNVAINIAVLYIIALLIHLKIQIFGRVEHAFVFAFILSIVYLVNTFQKESRILFIIPTAILFYIIFMKYIASGTLAVDNDVYINPYQTILERGY